MEYWNIVKNNYYPSFHHSNIPVFISVAEKMERINKDDLVKSRFYPVFVIPAKAGIQLNQAFLGSRLRGSDGFSDFLRDHQ